MERNITKAQLSTSTRPKLTRVAAYARVSSGKDAMLHSLAAQVNYYSGLIQRHPGWIYAGVYSDEALTGTKEERPEFQRMLTDCRDGKIDIILTKSITRFARNTVTLLETVRELKSLGIEVRFEKENIHSMGGDGELMLSILASFAQEESFSVSENCKWRMRNKFKQGNLHSVTMLGYRLAEGQLEIVPEEAEIVRGLYADYLAGMGKNAIMKKLDAAGVKGRNGKRIGESGIVGILRNEKYVGDLLLQKSFSNNHLEKRLVKNQGELPQYYVRDDHEAIVDRDTFERVQQELDRRIAEYAPAPNSGGTYPFSGLMRCAQCGKHYRRKIANAGTPYEKPVWICSTFNTWGKAACASKQIPESILHEVTAEVLGLPAFDESVFVKQTTEITVPAANRLVFLFADGHSVEKTWQDKSRAWGEDAKQRARERQFQYLQGRSKV